MKEGEIIKVYSHPRSGTHLLEAFIAQNFFPTENLKINEVRWGHWSNRKIREKPNPYGKLFGSHIFPSAIKPIDHPAIYIYRDPRAVAYSIWKTPNFINPRLKGISFSDFLRTKIDWIGSPAFKCRKKYNIFQHWEKHVIGWIDLASKNDNLIVVEYEDLLNNPCNNLFKISNFFNLPSPKTVIKIEEPVGLLPNQARTDSWKKVFSDQDLKFYEKSIRSSELKERYRR